MPLYASRKEYWRDFAVDAARLDSPLYRQLALAVDGDDEIKALAQTARSGQPPANLLFGAVHYLLLKGVEHPLRRFYPTLGGSQTGGVYPVFRDFVLTHRQDIAGLIESKVTNTNEVARSSVLRAGFAELARRETAPLHLIEIGPSAGLNLIWDRYGIRYGRDGEILAAVNTQSLLQLDCELRGPHMPPLDPLPVIAGRQGLERNPVDLTKAEDRDWLRALIWPDQPHRLQRLDQAIALFRDHPQTIVAGDALELLPEAMAEAPPSQALCIYHSIVTYQFSAEMKEALHALLVMAGLRRRVWDLAFEFDGADGYLLTLTRHEGGLADETVLARAQPHGGWLEWLLA